MYFFTFEVKETKARSETKGNIFCTETVASLALRSDGCRFFRAILS